MYKTEKSVQMTFEGFNQSCGMKLNVRDEWVVIADSIDWAAIEEKYMAFFPSRRGRPAVNARMALAVLVANLFGAGLSFFVFHFVDATDGVASCDRVEVQDDAA